MDKTITIRCNSILKKEVKRRVKQLDTDISKLGRNLFREFLRKCDKKSWSK